MYHNKPLIIKDDAIFVADVHYNLNRIEFKSFLLKIQNKQLLTTQLFLLGDIFDFLSNEITHFKNQNKEIIDLLNELSEIIDIVYLEGNHDFNLKPLFPNIIIVPRHKQPFYCTYQSKKVALSHGDIFTSFGYNLYTSIIRNKLFLYFINIININNWITSCINNWLIDKNIISKCSNTNQFRNTRLSLYDKDMMVIEGHFHYGILEKNYINLPAFAKDSEYYSIKNNLFIKNY